MFKDTEKPKWRLQQWRFSLRISHPRICIPPVKHPLF